MDIIKKAAQELKDRVNKTSQLEKLLQECTSKENWQAHPKTLNTIADYTRDSEESQIIFKYLWEKLSKADKSWIVTFKTLVLIEYLLKNGSPRCIMQFKDEIYKIRKFQDYQYLEDGEDKGASVRQRSKNIIDLLTDEDKLDNERQTAKELKEKMSSVSTGPYGGMGSNSNGGTYGSASSSSQGSSKYPGFNKDSYKDQKYGGQSSKDTPTFNYKSSDPYDSTEFKGLDKYRKKEETQPKFNEKQQQPTATVVPKPVEAPKVSIAQIKIQPPSGKPAVSQPVVVVAAPAKPAVQIVDLFADEPTKQQPQSQQDGEWDWSPAPQQVQQNPKVQAIQQQQQVQSDFQQFQQAPQPYQQAPQVYQQAPQLYQQAPQVQQYPSQPAQPQFQQQPYYQQNTYQQNQTNKLPSVQQSQNNPIDLFSTPTPVQLTTSKAQTNSNTQQDIDLFSDFQTSTTNSKKDNYSKDEFDLINLGDLKQEADKKQKEKEAKTQNANEFGFSTLTTQLDQFSINPTHSNFTAPNNFTMPQQSNYAALNNLNWGQQQQYPMQGYQNGMGIQGQQGYPVQQGYVQQQGYGQPSYGYNGAQNNNFRM